MSMSDGEHHSKRPYEPASTNAEPSESREGDNSQPLRKRVVVACEQGSEEPTTLLLRLLLLKASLVASLQKW